MTGRVYPSHRAWYCPGTMRLAVFGPTHPIRGGISHYTTLLVRALRQRHEVDFFSIRYQYPPLLYPGEAQYAPLDDPEAIREVHEPLFHSLQPWTWQQIVRRVAKGNYDLFIPTWWTVFFALASGHLTHHIRRAGGPPVCWLCHNVKMHEDRAIDQSLVRLGLGGAQGYIVHSQEDAANLKKLFPNPRVWVHVHPTYDHFATLYQERMQGALPPPPARPTCLFFGVNRDYKGLKYLIAAWPLVMRELPEAHLLIAGSFWDDPNTYREQARALGVGDSVEITAEYIPNEQVGDWFAQADVTVLPYRSATQSGIVQIAYGFDLPVIVTRVGGLPEVVAEGETGYVVEKENPEALASAIVKFFREGGRARMIPAIREYRKRFDWSAMVDRIEEIATTLR